jgi:hypothetical protein
VLAAVNFVLRAVIFSPSSNFSAFTSNFTAPTSNFSAIAVISAVIFGFLNTSGFLSLW